MARFRMKKKELLPELLVIDKDPIDSKGEFSDNGIFSERIFGDESDLNNVGRHGLVSLGNNYIINPLAYYRIKKLLPSGKLEAMINFNPSIDEDGKFVEDEKPNENIGLVDFKKNFLSIISQIKPELKETKEYRRVIQMFLEGHLFHNYIHVFSPKLRPAMVNKKSKSYTFSQINSLYNLAISHANSLIELDDKYSGSDNLLQKNNLLLQLQEDAQNILNMTIDDNIKGKKGTIRKNILGSRVNYSARLVIAPDPTLRMNEISMNYSTFLELYRNLIVNLIVKIEGLTYKEANKIIEEAKVKFIPKVHRYMVELVNKTKGGMHIILNRNPSISESSIQIMKIAKVKDKLDDAILEISNTILPGMGGDYDGSFYCCH